MNGLLLDEVLEKLEGARRYEDYVMGMCMFHDGYRPNLMVHEDTYYCLSCGAAGSTQSLLDKLQGIPTRVTKVKYVRNPFSKWLKQKDSLFDVLKESFQILKRNDGFKSYLYQRGLDDWSIQKLRLGYKEDWYTFPIFNKNKKVIGAVARAGEGRTTGHKYIVPQGQDPNLIYIPSWERLEAQGTIFLTYGILDAISIFLCGFASLSTLSGQRLDPSALDQFRKRIVVFPDIGEEASAIRLANNLGWRGDVVKIQYAENCKDPADIFTTNKPLLKEVLNNVIQTT